MVYRIKVEEIGKKGKHKHIKDYYLDTLEDLGKIDEFVSYIEYQKRKAEEYYKRIKKKEEERYINSDLFDKRSIGKDISHKEFLENEKDIIYEKKYS